MPIHALRRATSGSGGLPAITYVTSYASTSNATTYSFSSSSIGTASADRLVVVVVENGVIGASAARTLSSGTIGGVSATVHTGTSDADTGPANPVAVDMMSLVVASGTTATIAVTLSGLASCCKISIYTVTGYRSTTPTVYTGAGTLTAQTVAITGSHPYGAGIGGAVSSATATTFSLSTDGPAIVEDSDSVIRSGITGCAGSMAGVANTPTVTFDPASASVVAVAAMMAVWS